MRAEVAEAYGADEINGARLMQYWGGDGAARIEAIEGNDVLMEWLEGGTLGDIVRADAARDGEAAEVLCGVLAGLHRPRATPLPVLVPLEQQMAPLQRSDLAFLPAEARPRWRRAQEMLAELLATTTERLPLHGDLHHDNVMGAVASGG